MSDVVSFTGSDARRIAGAVHWVERHAPGVDSYEPVPWNDASGLDLGKVQTDFQTGTQISVKACDANGVEFGSAFNVYVYAGGGSADLTAVTVANTAATATCKLAAGKIIGYAFSGSDAYMLGDVAQVLKDWWVDAGTLKVVYAVYWRVGLAVSTVSNVTGPDVFKSKRIDCVTGQVSDGGLAAGGGSYT